MINYNNNIFGILEMLTKRGLQKTNNQITRFQPPPEYFSKIFSPANFNHTKRCLKFASPFLLELLNASLALGHQKPLLFI